MTTGVTPGMSPLSFRANQMLAGARRWSGAEDDALALRFWIRGLLTHHRATVAGLGIDTTRIDALLSRLLAKGDLGKLVSRDDVAGWAVQHAAQERRKRRVSRVHGGSDRPARDRALDGAKPRMLEIAPAGARNATE